MEMVKPLPNCCSGQVTFLLVEKSRELLDVARLPVALLHKGLIHNADEYGDDATCSPPLIASWISAVHTKRQTVRAT